MVIRDGFLSLLKTFAGREMQLALSEFWTRIVKFTYNGENCYVTNASILIYGFNLSFLLNISFPLIQEVIPTISNI